ncbi:MAG: response regulator [Lachnospiraceae bacterium]|nr:response regulator [Lachnospiraceae bacterium]
MYSILVVDDEEILLRGICDAIKASNLPLKSVEIAHGAKEALDKLAMFPCDIILSDISMPDMNGLEMIRKAREIWPDIRVLFLTGYREFEYAHEALKLNCDDFLIKPLSDEKLIAAIEKVIDSLDGTWMQRFEMRIKQEQEEQVVIEPQEKVRSVVLKYRSKTSRVSPEEISEGLQAMLGKMVSFYCSKCSFRRQEQLVCLFYQLTEDSGQSIKAVKKIYEEVQSFFLEQLDIETTVCFFPQMLMSEVEEHLPRWNEKYMSGEDFGKLIEADDTVEDSDAKHFVVYAVQNYVHDNPQGNLSLGELSEKFRINPSYLSRIFRKETGLNLSEYILRERLSMAKKLLLETDKKIYEIAEETGFETAGYFTRVFHKYEHMSPKVFRTQL